MLFLSCAVTLLHTKLVLLSVWHVEYTVLATGVQSMQVALDVCCAASKCFGQLLTISRLLHAVLLAGTAAAE
jgi:hypothetical protein